MVPMQWQFMKASVDDFPDSTLATTVNLIDALVYDTSDSDDDNLMALLGLNSQINENENSNKRLSQYKELMMDLILLPHLHQEKLMKEMGFLLNGINFSFNQESYYEGEQIEINFTTEEAVEEPITIFFNLDYENFDHDYSYCNSVTFDVGQDSVIVTIDIIDDDIDEGDEDFMFSLSIDDENYLLLNNNSIVRVNDNDFIRS